jgi:hypothetical protein
LAISSFVGQRSIYTSPRPPSRFQTISSEYFDHDRITSTGKQSSIEQSNYITSQQHLNTA